MRNVVLVGFMGTGKTQVAKMLAKAAGLTYVSTDEKIELAEKRSISEIFRVNGEAYFRKVEKEVIKEVSKGDNQVIDTGGGVVLDMDNMKNLRQNGIIICLWASEKVIYERTKKYNHRPLLNVSNPEERIKEILDKRAPFYKEADFHIDTTELDLGAVVGKVRGILNEHGQKK